MFALPIYASRELARIARVVGLASEADGGEMPEYLNFANVINGVVLALAVWALLCLLTPRSRGSDYRLANAVRAVGFLLLAFLVKGFTWPSF